MSQPSSTFKGTPDVPWFVLISSFKKRKRDQIVPFVPADQKKKLSIVIPPPPSFPVATSFSAPSSSSSSGRLLTTPCASVPRHEELSSTPRFYLPSYVSVNPSPPSFTSSSSAPSSKQKGKTRPKKIIHHRVISKDLTPIPLDPDEEQMFEILTKEAQSPKQFPKKRKHTPYPNPPTDLFHLTSFSAPLKVIRKDVGGEIAWYFCFCFFLFFIYFVLSLVSSSLQIHFARRPSEHETQLYTRSNIMETFGVASYSNHQVFLGWAITTLSVMILMCFLPCLYSKWMTWYKRTGRSEVELEGSYGREDSTSVDAICYPFEVTPALRRLGILKSASIFLCLFAVDLVVNSLVIYHSSSLGTSISFTLVSFLVFIFNLFWSMLNNYCTNLELPRFLSTKNFSVFLKGLVFENGTVLYIFWFRQTFNPPSSELSCKLDLLGADLLQMLIMQMLVAPWIELIILRFQRPIFRRIAEKHAWVTEAMKEPSFECPPLYSKCFHRLFLTLSTFHIVPMSTLISCCGMVLVNVVDRIKLKTGLSVVRNQLNNDYLSMILFGWFLILVFCWFLPPIGTYYILSSRFDAQFCPIYFNQTHNSPLISF